MNSEQLAWLIRRHCVEMTHRACVSHIGSDFSASDILATLYAGVLRYDADDPQWRDRDRFLMSKGHASAALYAALAESGFFPVEELMTFCENGSRLIGHVSSKVPGVEFSTGSLGHGFSVAVGMAFAAKKSGDMGHKIYALLGDGECNEGSVWEAALFANHFRLNNLVAIIDRNQMQSLDFGENTMELDDPEGAYRLIDKWRVFGWRAIEVDGHDLNQLKAAFEEASENADKKPHKPTVVIADTIKGRGVSYMQNDVLWHYRYPHQGWEYDVAVRELCDAIPDGVVDPYASSVIMREARPENDGETADDHALSSSWKTTYPEQMRRVEARPGTDERVHAVIEDKQ